MNKSKTVELRRKYVEVFGRAPNATEFRRIKKGYREDPKNYIKDLERLKVKEK